MASKHFSRADILYRKVIRNKFFSHGWGSIDRYRLLQRLKRDLFNAEKFEEIVQSGDVKIDKIQEVKSKTDAFCVLDGHFLSPVANYYPKVLPEESEIAQFQVIVPTERRSNEKQPMCIQLAGTGDHHFWKRRNLVAKPLLREHLIGSVLLVNPFYGSRKPKSQTRSSLNYVVDLLSMGCALIVETSVLLNWCEEQGYGPLAVTGVSMGGHMASIAATFVPKPVAVIPCLACTTASPVYTKGVLSNAVAWSVLQQELQDTAFFEELKYICSLVESDGLKAWNSDITGTNMSTFPQELMNVLNNTINPLISKSMPDFSIQYSGKDMKQLANSMQDNCESISLEMLTNSLKNQVENNIKSKVPLLSSILQKEPIKYDQAMNFMTYLMDITTHLGYYKKPVDPSLAVFVQAQFDGYMPNMDCPCPSELWLGCGVKYVNAGHIFAALYKQDVFRKIIAETLARS